jgi:2-polyprenyl-3-methyl-5-hydroxy-6-metoxy-1,4-benzoquinol methylase
VNIEKYAKKHKHYLKDQIPEELDLLIKHNKFEKIIDIGCGGGLFLYSLFKRGYDKKFTEVWGVDLSEVRLKNIKEISENIIVQKEDAQLLGNVPDDHFNIVVSTQVIEHVSDDEKMLNAIHRITKHNGLVYIDTVFKKKWAWYFYRNQYGKYALDPTHEREYQKESELFDKVDQSKFRILFSTKQRISYSVINFIIRMLKIKNSKIIDNPIVRYVSFVKIPVPGYFIWKILLEKK